MRSPLPSIDPSRVAHVPWPFVSAVVAVHVVAAATAVGDEH